MTSKNQNCNLHQHIFHRSALLWMFLLLSAFCLLAAGCQAVVAEESERNALPEPTDPDPALTEAEWLVATAGDYLISAYLTAAPASYQVDTLSYRNASGTAVYHYPQIRELADEQVQEQINATLFNNYYAEEIDWHDIEQNPNIDFSVDPPASLTGEVEVALHREISSVVTVCNDAFLCVVVSDYLEGSVSYVVTLSAQTFDLSTGEQIYLSDLMALNETSFAALLADEEAQEYAEQHESWWYGATDWAYGNAPAYLDSSTHFYSDHFTVCYPSYLNYENLPGYRLVEYPYSALESFWLPTAIQW